MLARCGTRLTTIDDDLDAHKIEISQMSHVTATNLSNLKFFQEEMLHTIAATFVKLTKELDRVNAMETSLLYLNISEMTEQESFGLEISERMRIIHRDMIDLSVNTLGEDMVS